VMRDFNDFSPKPAVVVQQLPMGGLQGICKICKEPYQKTSRIQKVCPKPECRKEAKRQVQRKCDERKRAKKEKEEPCPTERLKLRR
jgi:hypothetical protein